MQPQRFLQEIGGLLEGAVRCRQEGAAASGKRLLPGLSQVIRVSLALGHHERGALSPNEISASTRSGQNE